MSTPKGGHDYSLPSRSGLSGFQTGYRWHGAAGQRLAEWHDDWLVVADCGGDPFIFDRATSRVLFDCHGQGVWQPRDALADLPTMAACLATVGSVVRSAGQRFTGDDQSVRPEHRREAVWLLTDLVGPPAAAEFIVTDVTDRTDWA